MPFQRWVPNDITSRCNPITRPAPKITGVPRQVKGWVGNNINLKLWTEKAFGSFRGYHRFSTALNSAQLSFFPT